ncbi:MAG: preprotein translocase subunit SecY [Clostridia bacterium]
MFEVARNAFKVSDLRRKILYTILIIVLFRLGSAIPVPFIDATGLAGLFAAQDGVLGQGGMFNFLNIMAGGALSKASIFAMSIGPYITASIVMQLLSYAIPPLERLQKEGEEGRKKIAQITRYVTIVLGLVEGFGFYSILANEQGIVKYHGNWFATIVIVLCFGAGTAIIMWLGEKINEVGIGNGISIILFASIVSRGPQMVLYVWEALVKQNLYWLAAVVIIVAVALIVSIVVMNDAERRVPIQYAKRVVGRKMYGGQNTHLPLKVTMTGVLPIIFASSFVMLPATISAFFPNSGFANFITKYFGYTSIPYAIIYFVLIIAFNYFYVSMQYNPVEMSNNIKQNGGFIPGIRPGKPTSDFISKILNKVSLIGALFLGLIAVLPIFMNNVLNINIALGGTSILIVVGVVLETMKQLESQMLMRHYKGFLE